MCEGNFYIHCIDYIMMSKENRFILWLIITQGLLKKRLFVFEIKEVFILTILFPSVGVFVSFFSHYCVYACVEHFIEEVLWFILDWIQKTLTKTSVWSN